MSTSSVCVFFFFNDTATTEIYTLSLHDALPISMLDRLARTLSGGMLRRLEIATALLKRPVVLFLDEPTVGLDPTARRLVWERLELLREEAGTTVLVTIHQMEEAERQCDRIAVMDRGTIATIGTPQELRS